ncbi:MAG: N-ethylmaleimide reductase [Myxococcales bacterium]|nr:N-ethylmaleimide reductase [Myxococcales bacterium]
MVVASHAPTQQPSSEVLFQPIRIGGLDVPHRIVMAPLTRSRARTPGNVPTELMAAYYAQRASAALIISEATQVSMQGQGYAWTPGIHSREQVEGWRRVTDEVHKAGGRMFMQLWHVGRISHPALQPDHMLPVAPSPITPAGKAFIENEHGEGELVPFVRPRALDLDEMPYLVRQYARGARNAQIANADGIEVHGANGYLLEQFLATGTNHRVDAYGGPVEQRARLLLEVVEACIAIWGPERVGVRISPLSTFNDIQDDNPEATFSYVAEQLAEYKLAYLHVINPAATELQTGQPIPQRVEKLLALIRSKFRGVLMMAGGFTRDTAAQWIEAGRADLIAFGRAFLANPDLPERFRRKAGFNQPDPKTFYGGGEHGYTDYPSLEQELGTKPRPTVDTSWR